MQAANLPPPSDPMSADPSALFGHAGQAFLEALPVAAYACDAAGWITHYNEAAAVLWGRRPVPGRQRWCGAWRMCRTDGRAMAPAEGPVAEALRTARAVESCELVLERPRQEPLQVALTVHPVQDALGRLVGAVATLVDIGGAKRQQQRLWESDLTWRLMFDSSPVAQMLCRHDGTVASVNERFLRLSGYSRAELVGRDGTRAPLHVEDELSAALLAAVRTHGRADGMEFHLRRKDGEVRRILISSCPLTVEGVAHRMHTLVDITALRRQEKQLRLAAQVFAQGREGLLVTDAHRNIILVNQAFTAITGYGAEEVMGQNPRMLASGRQDKAFYDTLWETVEREGTWQGEIWNRHKNGTVYPEHLMVTLMRGPDGEISHYVGTFSDMSAETAARERIDWLSHFDALTGLPNRSTLAERCAQAMAAQDGAPRQVALAKLGIDRFMAVNDTLGHAAGDEVLRCVAQRLRELLRPGDLLARIGGDEFALLLDGADAQVSQGVVAQLLASVAQPMRVNGVELNLTASAGLAHHPADGGNGGDAVALLKASEVALHQAKLNGRGVCCVFEAGMLESSMQEAALVSALRNAAAAGQLQLHYQPFVDMQSGAICGMEALLRWDHPELGSVSPARFIPVAERSGLILDIGAWVVRQACRDIRQWLDRGMAVPRVSINISPIQFRGHGLLEQIEAAMAEFRVPAAQLCVEVTEGALMEDPAHGEVLLRAMKKLGVRLSLDDFGTGYSSLSYLKHFPFDKVKIDQSFVRGLVHNPQDAVIARVVIAMAHELGLHVIAEGVETEAQAEFMRANMCDEIQGYFFSRPLPPEALCSLLATDPRLPANLVRVRTQVRTLLLVDDDPLVLAWLRDLLQDSGYRLLCASGGAEGLQMLSQHAVDVIVTDQRMPGMSGVDFLRQAKALHPQTMRIVLSGHADLQMLADAVNEGAVYRFLTKPWNDRQLLEAIGQAFAHKELAEENRNLNLRIRTAHLDLAASHRQMREALELPPT